MAYRVTLIPGDGVGPEVIDAAVRCIEATGVRIKWEIWEAGEAALEKYGTPLPEGLLESIRRNKVALKGPVTTPVGTGYRSVNVAIRKTLDLYAGVRPAKLYPGVPSRYENVDIIVIRENTEDVYIGIEFEKGKRETLELLERIENLSGQRLRKDSGISIKTISEYASERIFRFAFEFARKHGRRKVTAVHKANIQKFTDGLFLEVGRRVAEDYPDVEFEDVIVDALCMKLVRNPADFDVLVCPNLYGDIISDLCAGLIGGLGVAPGANIGDECAVFEPVHGSAPKYKGQNKVNPTATILSGVMMLRHLGESEAADLLERAVAEVIREGKNVTYDLLPPEERHRAVGTKEMADAIIRKIEEIEQNT